MAKRDEGRGKARQGYAIWTRMCGLCHASAKCDCSLRGVDSGHQI